MFLVRIIFARTKLFVQNERRVNIGNVLVRYFYLIIYTYKVSRFMGLGKVVEPCGGCYILLFSHLYIFYMYKS